MSNNAVFARIQKTNGRNMKLYFSFILIFVSPITDGASGQRGITTASTTALINQVMNDFHLAAERADAESFLGQLSETAVLSEQKIGSRGRWRV